MEDNEDNEDNKDNKDNVNILCRFYPQPYPAVDDLVYVEVKSVEDTGAYVSLLEYNNIEGMILLSEFSRKRVRSVNKLTRIGRKEVVVVLRVDENKGYIDLSKRRVSADEIAQCEDRYKKAKEVHSILRNVACTHSVNIESLYKSVGWPLYLKYGHAGDAFNLAVENPDYILADLTLPNDHRETLLKCIKTRMAPKAVKARSDFELTCYDYAGIGAIRTALSAGTECSSEKDIKVSIKLIASPKYVMVLTAADRDEALICTDSALKVICKSIKKQGGSFKLSEPPHIIDDHGKLDEQILRQTLMNKTFSDLDEELDEGMGDVDLGVNTAELDACAERLEQEDSEEEKGN